MKRPGVLIVLTFLVVLTASLGLAQPMGPGYGPAPEGDWRYCPYCGRCLGPGGGYGMGPGMMGRGYGRGPGWGRGYGMGPGPGYGQGYPQPARPLAKKDVQDMMEEQLKAGRNPNLKVGEIDEKDDAFEVQIVTKDNSLVDTILVDKHTGGMRPAY